MPQETAVKDDARPAATPPDDLSGAVEAILLTLDKPVPARRLAEGLGLVAPEERATDGTEGAPIRRKSARGQAPDGVHSVEEAVASLNAQYAQTGRSFRIESVAGGY